MNPYLNDIFNQPKTLRTAVEQFDPSPLLALRTRLLNGEFDRIVLTGMGASLFAAHPAYLALQQQNLPVILENAAELNQAVSGLIGERTLLWMCSQSGRSAELVKLLEHKTQMGSPLIFTVVNDPESPMGTRSDYFSLIHAGEENSVSTKTYVNMLAVNLLATEVLLGNDPGKLKTELLKTAEVMETWLNDWDIHKESLDGLLGDFKDLFILGRGISLASVWCGALINKEAAKVAVHGMHAADFRHGPLELCEDGLVALIFEGQKSVRELNQSTTEDIRIYGGRAVLIGGKTGKGQASFELPQLTDRVLPIIEILPVQLLSVLLAERKGIVPGVFRHVGKVTTKE